LKRIDSELSEAFENRKHGQEGHQRQNSQGREDMNFLTRAYLTVRENNKSQTMTEYALILAAIAVVVFATYQIMGQDIGSMVNKVDTALASS
jgi:Flp pilus assembly pilin Flp